MGHDPIANAGATRAGHRITYWLRSGGSELIFRATWLGDNGCGLEQALSWPDSVDAGATQIVCRDCRTPLDTGRSGRWIAEAPGNSIRGYHLSRLSSPWPDLSSLLEASEAPTPAGQQEFYNPDLGESFTAEGGGLSFHLIDRCRRDYGLDDYDGERCVMGIDAGTNLHVVIRGFSEAIRRDAAAPRPLWHASIVPRFEDLDALIDRHEVASVVIDAQPEIHKVSEFAASHDNLVRVAWYNRHEGDFESVPARDHRPAGYRLNRVEAIDRTFQRFHDGAAELPSDARALGESGKRGVGEYYCKLLALQRTLEKDAQGNWQARWIDRGQADHFAHAEVYCLYAEEAVPYPLIDIGRINADPWRPSPWGDTGQRPWHVRWDGA